MHWLGGLAYLVGATAFQIDGRTPTLVLLAAILVSWLTVAVVMESRTLPAPVPVDGWTAAPTDEAARTAASLRRLAVLTSTMRIGLSLFGLLFASWSLIP